LKGALKGDYNIFSLSWLLWDLMTSWGKYDLGVNVYYFGIQKGCLKSSVAKCH